MLEKIVREENIEHVILAGDEAVVIPLLREQMPKTLEEKVIETLSLGIDTPEHELLEESLRRRYFLPKITAILSASERFGSSQWEVETDRGPRTLSTGVINEAVTEVEPGRYLITDVEGNRFEIPDLMQLDEASRARFLGKA